MTDITQVTEDGPSPRPVQCTGGGRNRTNFWLNVATALSFCAMAGSGLLQRFVLVRRGGGSWLGWSRHDWGEVHFWLGCLLVALVTAHLLLHRDWIARCWRRFAGSWRSPVSWTLLAAGLALMFGPLLVPAEPAGAGQRQRGGFGARASGRSSAEAQQGRPRHGRGFGRRSADRRGHDW